MEPVDAREFTTSCVLLCNVHGDVPSRISHSAKNPGKAYHGCRTNCPHFKFQWCDGKCEEELRPDLVGKSPSKKPAAGVNHSNQPEPTEEETVGSAEAQGGENEVLCEHLTRLAEGYAVTSDSFRSIAFKRVAELLRNYPQTITSGAQASKLKGVGKSMVATIDEILTTGSARRLTELEGRPEFQAKKLFQSVHGIGAKKAQDFYNRGFRTLEDLATRPDATLSKQTKIFLQYYQELTQKIPREEVASLEACIRGVAHQIDAKLSLTVCGSYRRGKSASGDIDILITHPDHGFFSSFRSSNKQSMLMTLLQRLHEQEILTHDLGLPHEKHSSSKSIFQDGEQSECYMGIGRLPGRDANGNAFTQRRIDIRVYHYSEIAFAILYFTGSAMFNRALRLFANKKGFSLSDKALTPFVWQRQVKVAQGNPVRCFSEKEIFAALQLPYYAPSAREGCPAELEKYA